MLHLQLDLAAENAIDWAQYIPAVIGLGGVVVGGLITFGMQAWERHLTRTAKMMSEVAEIVVLSTAIKDGLQTIHMPAVEYKLSQEQNDSFAAKATSDWAEAQAKLLRLSLTANKHISAAGSQLLESLKTATNYLDPHSRPGLRTDFEHGDQMLRNVEFEKETLISVSMAPILRKRRTLASRREGRPGE
ncbi:hypothetical protein KRR55_19470 [Paeniglutamicibacter sp. ABSL32-1]|uniref:hypothetical protein n=1 Tax=Paeniglutamicibacter quisquiliarum TaxID=2849498 RepID=UPI001C2D4652|nr:hypothetical protein [Paeniglutamicibacter quisquiliarum]MBV1781294.1 hypothetical protein [Paeniglutamicibacter quisquiliarum]